MLRVKQPVTVTAGQTVTANVQDARRRSPRSPVVTTATGEQRRVEVGNAIAQIDAAKLVRDVAVANMGDLLTARAPGVMVVCRTRRPAPARAFASAARARCR